MTDTFRGAGSCVARDAIDLFHDDARLGRFLEVCGPARCRRTAGRIPVADQHRLPSEESRGRKDGLRALQRPRRRTLMSCARLSRRDRSTVSRPGNRYTSRRCWIFVRELTKLFLQPSVCTRRRPRPDGMELLDTLELCDRLEDRTNQRSCNRGAFYGEHRREPSRHNGPLYGVYLRLSSLPM